MVDRELEVVWGSWDEVVLELVSVLKHPNPDEPEVLDLLRIELGGLELEDR